MIAKQFAPVVSEFDAMNIDKYNAYIRLLINNVAQRAFNFKTLPPDEGNPELAKLIKELSRRKYGVDRETIEQEILERTKLGS